MEHVKGEVGHAGGEAQAGRAAAGSAQVGLAAAVPAPAEGAAQC